MESCGAVVYNMRRWLRKVGKEEEQGRNVRGRRLSDDGDDERENKRAVQRRSL